MFPLKLGSASHAELLAPPCLVAAAPIRGQGGGARALLGSESVGAPEVYNSTLTLSPPEISRVPDLSLNRWQNILLALNFGESDSLLYSPGHLFAGGKAVENGYNVC